MCPKGVTKVYVVTLPDGEGEVGEDGPGAGKISVVEKVEFRADRRNIPGGGACGA